MTICCLWAKLREAPTYTTDWVVLIVRVPGLLPAHESCHVGKMRVLPAEHKQSCHRSLVLCQTLSNAGGPPMAAVRLRFGGQHFFFFLCMEGSCFHCKVHIYFQPSPLIRCFPRGTCLLLLMLLENECADVPRLYYTFTSTLEVIRVLDMIQTSFPHGCWIEVHLETPSSHSETQALKTGGTEVYVSLLEDTSAISMELFHFI